MKRTLSKVRRVSIGLGLTRVPMHMGPTPREVGENHLQLICTLDCFFAFIRCHLQTGKR